MDAPLPPAPPIVCRSAPPAAPPVAAYDTAPTPTVTTKIRAGGWHTHRCPSCSVEWSHPDTSKGNAESHACPACEKQLPLPWLPFESRTRIVESVQTPPAQFRQDRYYFGPPVQAACPNGQCPTPRPTPQRGRR